MSKRRAPRGSGNSQPDSGGGKKPPSAGQEKAKFKSDTRKRIEEGIAVLDFRLHLEYLNVASAVGGGDFEEFKRSWLMNYYNAMTASGFKDKPKTAPSREQQPRLIKTNDELMEIRDIKSDNLSTGKSPSQRRRERLLPNNDHEIG
ncbi:MAG: hypothetical protein P5702_22135 [Limnospira sp. PMC 1291.21]|uniref:hypothetical protein n=1 Tax=unclassified Limnospira TaxID=2642885 RepID=UPI0028E17C7E|nr:MULTISPECIES: hypothetical protein [unclassified Limnospira]MDT9179827.1 hypothetical protein [Limnospira sp. PMC 1238.20]MDT9195638.1 hypothetical protein [Limnospira sp. PMC 1245.20]MDT9225710.1 hypothetical protein [Limnospira sp. PMC 1279.21]MDT9251855.1 hypothetical protein [Limnospira sp. PMC 1280.21]MDT9256388.1 hypothetical protein [Limnospira sp. PMC 1254.20]